jgi:predicted TIM-barrel fold metal-dependent hydrolase
MDEAGVDVAVAAGIGWNDLETARQANEYIMEAVARYPRRLVGFCGLNPTWGEAALREMERCARGGLRGIGELRPDTQGFRLDDQPAIAPFMEAARRLGLVTLIHASEPVGHLYRGKGHVTPAKSFRFIERFPENLIICAHWGGGLPFYALMPEVGAALQNTWFDTAASPFLYDARVFPTVVGLVGAERILFASDFPLLRPARMLAHVRQSGLDAKAERLVLGENAALLLGLAAKG